MGIKTAMGVAAEIISPTLPLVAAIIPAAGAVMVKSLIWARICSTAAWA